MGDYTYQYRECLLLDALATMQWDVFISAFNRTERVQSVFEKANAVQKDWLVHSEYQLSADQVPAGSFSTVSQREDEFVLEYVEARLATLDLSAATICVDVTGFMRPQMLYFMRFMAARGVKRLDVLYTEPGHYPSLDETQFASERVHSVRQVAGFEGITVNQTKNDLLIINAGFEDKLIAEVAEDKDKARKMLFLGLPSLKADMYQQGVLRTRRARDALGDPVREIFAPASDPFATATVLSEIVAKENKKQGIDNLYLAPLATKPSALGFALYYITECLNTPVSIIYPFSESYAADASAGMGRIWRYQVEFP